MKSEHRRELRTNVLAEWVEHLPKFCRENLRVIIYVAVVLVAVAISAYFSVYRKKALKIAKTFEATLLIKQVEYNKLRTLATQTKQPNASDLLILTANNLSAVSRELKNDVLAALALAKEAEALRAELHYKSGPTDNQVVGFQINQAKQSYQKAQTLAEAANNATLTAIAKFGLGLCAEELGDFSQAKQIYQDIAENALFENTVFAVQARERLDTMDEYKARVTFAKVLPSPEPQVEPSLQEDVELNIQPDTSAATAGVKQIILPETVESNQFDSD